LQLNFGQFIVDNVPSLDECLRLQDILVIRQGTEAGLSPTSLKLNLPLEFHAIDLSELKIIGLTTMESLAKELQEQVDNKNNPTKPTTTTADADANANRKLNKSYSDPKINNTNMTTLLSRIQVKELLSLKTPLCPKLSANVHSRLPASNLHFQTQDTR
jgi:hypothetical protein